MEKSHTNCSQICPNRVNITPLGQSEPEYACGCPVGEGCHIDYLPPLIFESVLEEHSKHHPWRPDLTPEELTTMYFETPNERRRRNSRAKRETQRAVRKLSK